MTTPHASRGESTGLKLRDKASLFQLKVMLHVLNCWRSRGGVVNVNEFNDALQIAFKMPLNRSPDDMDTGRGVKIVFEDNHGNNDNHGNYGHDEVASVLASFETFADPQDFDGAFFRSFLLAYICSVFRKVSSKDLWDLELAHTGDGQTGKALRNLPHYCYVHRVIVRLPPSSTGGQSPSWYQRLLRGPVDILGCILLVQDPDQFPVEESSLLYGELKCIISLLHRQLDESESDTAETSTSAFVLTTTTKKQLRIVHGEASVDQSGQRVIRVWVDVQWDLPSGLESYNRADFMASLGQLVTAVYLESQPDRRGSPINSPTQAASQVPKSRNVSDPDSIKSTMSTATDVSSISDDGSSPSPTQSTDGGYAEDDEVAEKEE